MEIGRKELEDGGNERTQQESAIRWIPMEERFDKRIGVPRMTAP